MVRRSQERPLPSIWDLYYGVLDRVMADHNIEPQRVHHVVGPDADFPEVVQHTDWFLRRNGMQFDNYREHYRYDRYDGALGLVWNMRPGGGSSHRKTHVDIGCGAGLFSWVFLDRARISEPQYDHVESYGLDHSPQMLRLAREMREVLTQYIPDDLNSLLRYTDDADVLLEGLTRNHHPDTDYTVTFGHVLVQAHTTDAILNFIRVITHILRLLDAQSNCVLIAVDARGRSDELTLGWNLLLENLAGAGVRYELFTIPETDINDSDCVKVAGLFPAGRQEG